MEDELRITHLKGQSIRPFIPHLAKLRMSVFREYPYLYEGDLDYEIDYLHTYVCCAESIMVIVYDKERVVGVSTAIPLIHETIECQKPFLNLDLKIDDIFYFGESVLLPQYRGRGVYRKLFNAREQAAREYGSKIATFCAVEREKNDPRKPEQYVALDRVWNQFGYEKNPGLCAYYAWKEIGENEQTLKPMTFWLKAL